MSEVYICRRGGGQSGGAVYAALEVEYPQGCACHCSMGLRSYSAPDLSGRAVFALPEAGSWTVESDGLSKSVDIGQEQRIAAVKLCHETLYFDGGQPCDYSGGWSQYIQANDVLSLTQQSANETYLQYIYGSSLQAVELADVDELRVTVDTIVNGGVALLYLSQNADGGSYTNIIGPYEHSWQLQVGENVLDVSAIEGPWHLGFALSTINDGLSISKLEISRVAAQ